MVQEDGKIYERFQSITTRERDISPYEAEEVCNSPSLSSDRIARQTDHNFKAVVECKIQTAFPEEQCGILGLAQTDR